MNQKGFINIILIIVVVALTGAGAYSVATRQATTPSATSTTTPASKPISTSTLVNGGKTALKYYIHTPENQRVDGQVSFQLVLEDKNVKVNEAGPVVAFTLRKPDGSKLVSKSSLNRFVLPDCPPPPPDILSSCGQGFWSAGGRVIFETFPYYNQAGQYTITASDNRVRGTSFEVRNLQLGSLLIDVSGYKTTRISETIADGGANPASFITATYQRQGAPLQEVSVNVFAATSLENLKKRFDQISEFYPKVNFEGQTIAVFENSSLFIAMWTSGTYQLRVSPIQKIHTINAQEVLRAYLKVYPSSLSHVADNCNLIPNSTFRSINQYEFGLGPNGEVMGYWHISFQGTEFGWRHSDVSERGSYICKNNILQVKFFDHSITARYDGSKGILTWDGVEYKKVE